MTKELSKQICELCGVEPSITYQCTHTDINPYFTCVPPHCEKCDDAIILEKKYPDFGQPENFVNLIEIKDKDGIELCDWVITYAGSFANRKDFLCKLINLLTNQNTASFHEIPDIKQAIRDAEWKYE